MPKSKASASLFVPTESPVPGVSFELGTLLIQAIKARRKYLYLSKAYTGEDEDDTAQKLLKLQNSADDKTKLFLNELKQQVQSSSSSSSHKQQQHRGKKSTGAPQKCLDFLLDVLYNTDNSFHLRRSALIILNEILDRSSDARSYFASGQILLDFVAVIENAQETMQENNEENGTTSSSTGLNNMSPKSVYQLEAMEIIHNLASKFGQFYTQFTVASRLLGDVSVNFMHSNSLQNNTHSNNESNSNQPQRIDMRMFRRDRDDALEHGLKACQSLERMLGKVDLYFKVLVPRLGGFNTAGEQPMDTVNIDDDSKPAALSMSIHKEEVGEEEDDDNDSINWEEGDTDESDEHDTESIDHTTSSEHHAAVNHTLAVIGKSGSLLDGRIAVQVNGGELRERKPAATSTSDLAAETDQDQATNPTVEARKKLQKIVKKLSTTRLPRLNKWIQALIHADGMEERLVADPAAMGNEGQVSLVLISEEKRAIRGKLLQQMLKIKAEIEVLLKSAATLGIREDDTTEQTTETSNGSNSEARSSFNNSSSGMQRIYPSAGIRPSRLQSGTGIASKKRKRTIKVTYNKR